VTTEYAGDWTLRATARWAESTAIARGGDVSVARDRQCRQQTDCSKNRYTLTFPDGQLPPANASGQ